MKQFMHIVLFYIESQRTVLLARKKPVYLKRVVKKKQRNCDGNVS